MKNRVKATDFQQLYSLEEIAQKICDSQHECSEACVGFADCHKGQNGVLVWLRKVLKNEQN